MAQSDSKPLVIDRDLYVPRELVFDVWVDPEHLAGWYVPPEAAGGRVAGASGARGFTASWPDTAGETWTESWEFQELSESERVRGVLRLSGGRFQRCDSVVTLTLRDLGGGCGLTLEQSDFTSEECRAWYAEAWEHRLRRLEEYFSSI
jgi:uncharacterized protein YndB with AHSA1/START domain